MHKTIKKILSGMLAAAVALPAVQFSVLYSSAEQLIKDVTSDFGSGDVNGDGKVNSADIDAVEKLIGSSVKSIPSSGNSSFNVFKDDVIDVKDLMAVKQIADGKSPVIPENKESGKTVKFEVGDAECCPGEQVKVDINIIDWNQDIDASEIYLDFDSSLSLEDISCTGDFQYAAEGNELKIYGFNVLSNVYRGTVATLTFNVPDTAYGDYDVKIKDAYVYNSSFQTFAPETKVGLIAADVTERPLYLAASCVNSSSMKLAWSMPYCSGAMEGYIVYRDGVEIARTADAYYYDKDVISGKKYTYEVQAYGADGYLSAKSKSFTASPVNPKISSLVFPDNASVVGGKNTYLKCTLEKTVDVKEYSLSYVDLQGERQVIYSGNDIMLSAAEIKWNLSDVPSGDYELTFSVTDIDGGTAEKKVLVSVDTTPPEQVFGFEVFEGEEEMMLTWGISTEAKVVGYNIYRRTESSNYTFLAHVDSRDTLEYVDKNLSEGDVYFYMMCSVDEFGQEGIYSEEKSAAVKGDETPPEITLFLPESGNVLHSFVNISMKAEDNIGVNSISAFISLDDGETWEELYTGKGSSVNYRFDTTEYSQEKIKIKAVAYDYAGNESAGLVHIYAIDNVGPAKVQNINSVAVAGVTATISWDDVPDSDFSYFIVKYGKTGDESSEKTTTVNSTLGINLNDLTPDSEYYVLVAAVDIYGNVGEYSEPFNFVTGSDTAAPVIMSVKPEPGYYNSSIPLKISAQDDFSTSKITVQISDSESDDGEWNDIAVIENPGVGARFDGSFELDLSAYDDGTVYIRAFAEDTAGNVGEASAKYEYIIDKTAPDAPADLSVSSDSNAVQLKWKAYENNADSAAFSLYRSTEADGEYVKILDNTTLLNYYDRTAEPEQEYFYKLTAIDAAGNESAMSKAVSAVLQKDTENPEIVSLSPADGGILSTVYNSISALVSDNVKLGSVTMEYRLSEDAEYKVFSTAKDINDYYTVAEGTLPKSALSGEKVQIRISAADASGNIAESVERTYSVDNSTTIITEFEAEQLEEYISVTWKTEENDLSAGYYLYKKVNSGSWQKIGSVAAHTAGENGYSCTDKETNAAGTVVYKLEAYSNNGLKTTKESNSIKTFTNPEVSLNVENVQAQGVEYIFDATGCKDYYGISDITIDFGDGTSKSASSASDAKFIHKYTDAGEYNVKLTCENEQGLISTSEITIEVIKRELIGEVAVNVRTPDGRSASGINVYLDLGSDGQQKLTTDSSGRVVFKAVAGIHKIGVYGDGYLPAEKDCTVLAGKGNQFDFNVVKEEIVTADFEVKRMTLDEIKAAGININAPENQHIAKVEFSIGYKSDDTLSSSLSYYIDSKSGAVLNGGGGIIWGHGGSGSIEWGGSGGSSYRSEPVYIKVNPETNKVDTAIVLTVPVTASWLKEFFNVKLTVFNNADEQFNISNNDVTLNYPSGLTLMNTAVSSPANVQFASLPGKSSKEITWILRGDKAGEYDISADYYGVLDRFNEEINANFKAAEPITVYGESAVSVEVNVPSSMYYNQFQFEVAMTNNCPEKVYASSIDVGHVISSAFGASGGGSPQIYQQRIMRNGKYIKILSTSDKLDVLEPGDTYSVVYMVPDIFTAKDEEKEYMLTKLDVISSSIKAMEGSAVPVSLNVKSPIDMIVVDSLQQVPDYNPETQFIIAIREKMFKDLVKGVSITFNGETKVTGAEGYCIFDIPESGSGTLVINADGYEEYKKDDYVPSSTGIDMITLSPFTLDTGSPKPPDEEIVIKPDVPDWVDLDIDPDNLPLSVDFTGSNPSVKVQSNNPIFDGMQFDLTAVNLNMGGVTITEDGHFFLFCNLNPDTSPDADGKDNSPKKVDEEFKKKTDYKKKLNGDTGSLDGNGVKKSSKFDIGFQATAYLHAFVGTHIDENGNKVLNDFEWDKLRWEGKVGIEASASLTAGWQFFVGPVPIYCELGGEGKVGATGIVLAKGHGEYEGRLSLALGIKAFAYAGIGVSGITAGVYGDVGIDAKIDLIPSTSLDAVSGEANLHVKATLGPFEVKSPSLISGRLLIYDRDGDEEGSGIGGAIPDLINGAKKNAINKGNLIAQIYDSSKYTAIDRSYLSQQSGWNSKGAVDNSGLMTFNTLIENSGYNTSQKIVSNGEDTVMVFLQDDGTRNKYDASCLVYSVYDSENRSWSEPAQIDGNNTFDSAPYLYTDGTDIYVVYQDTSECIADDAEFTLEKWTAMQNIAAAKFNGETNTFDEPVLLTDDSGVYDSQPVIAYAGGKLSAAWISNENSDPFGMNNTNRIMYSEFDETNGWSEAVVLTENLSAVTELAAGEFNGRFFAAFAEDVDNDLSTAEGKRICAIDLSSKIYVVTEGEASGLKFRTSPEDNEEKLFWYQDGRIISTDDLTVCRCFMDPASCNITESFDIIGGKLFWISADRENAGNIYGCKYDTVSGAWSAPVPFSNQDEYIENISAADCGDEIIIAFNKNCVLLSDETVTSNNSLVWSSLDDIENLTLLDLDYSKYDALKPGIMPVKATVLNNGSGSISGITAKIVNSKGETVSVQNFDTVLASGESAEISIDFEIGEDFEYGKYDIIVSSDSIIDSNEADNSYDIDLDFEDVIVSVESADSAKITVKLVNGGTASSAGSLVIKNSAGEIIKTEENITVAPNEEKTAEMSIDDLDISAEEFIYVEFVNENEYYNDDNIVQINKSDIKQAYKLGDVNQDNVIDADDASYVLAEYARTATSKPSEFSEAQRLAADVNEDNVIDSDDASRILAYYAAVATGKVPSFK